MKTNAPVLPTLWDTFKAGFDLTTKHLWLILIPVLLDGFYWLGPRLSIRPVVASFLTLLTEQAAATNQPSIIIEQYTELWQQFASTFNLFTSLHLPFIGVPGLMAGLTPEKTPLQPQIVELDSLALVMLVVGVLSVVGGLFSLLYYTLVARVVREEKLALSWLWRELPQQVVHMTLILLVIAVTGTIFFVPFLCLAFLFALFVPAFALLLGFAGLMPGMTLVLYSFFSPHGVLFYDRPPLTAIRESIALVKMYQPMVISLFVLLYVVSQGSNLLWRLADDGSWLTLVSILGHGFVSTALAAATFIFYRDRYATLPSVAKKLPSVS